MDPYKLEAEGICADWHCAGEMHMVRELESTWNPCSCDWIIADSGNDRLLHSGEITRYLERPRLHLTEIIRKGQKKMAKLNIVLLEPEIPANTGNIGRTCVATDTKLHLIEPLGFSLSEKALKRAGMDYWKDLDVTTYLDYEDFVEKNPNAKIYYATTKALKTYTDVQYEEDCYIMFGKESAGIPEEILMEHKDNCVRIPMINEIRSLNLREFSGNRAL